MTRHVVPASSGFGLAADVGFGAVALVSACYLMYVGRDSWFFADEWLMAEQVRFPSGLVKPYNGHLSVLILGLYRGLLEVFGFGDYTPYRLAGVVSFVAVSVAMYVVMRREVGAVAAVVSGVLLLWPAGLTVEPGGLNHSLAAVGAIVCAYGLNGSGRRRDLLVTGGLSFALLSTGGGVAVMAATLVHCIVTRPPWRRWILVAVPSLLWIAWYALAVPDDPALDAFRPDLPDLLSFTFRHFVRSFSSLALGNRFGGVVVALLVLGVLGSRLRHGIVEAAGTLGWLVALVVWWFGIAWSRWIAEGFVFRYEFVSAVFLLLALLPNGASPTDPRPSRLPWPTPLRRVGSVRAVAPAVMCLTLLAVVPTSRSDVQAWGEKLGTFGTVQRGKSASLAFERKVADPAGYPGFAGLLPSQVQRLFEVFGAPPGYGNPTAYVEQAVHVRPGRRSVCPAGANKVREVSADRAVLAVAGDEPITVRVKPFDFAPQVAAEVPARSQKRLDLAGFGSKERWTVMVSAGCLLER